MSNPEFHIAECPCCGIGQVVITKILDDIYFICDECQTIWSKPQDCRECSNMVSDININNMTYPTIEEIKKLGLWEFVSDKGWY
ncbi:hypothetical protein mvi_52760 [Methylobacterium indicum]|uniref:Uncharacterized protein n=1 Tax=Methylobacterium indicum TaxID=1775910 RepID=A0A8H8WY83_9HYPH|nr:hypothetical protein mvi_52760 [Methylobacterium indicum]